MSITDYRRSARLGCSEARGSTRRTVRLAVGLWIALACVVWNVFFDRVLVVAGRQYVHAAMLAARASEPYLRVDDWMRPAISRAGWGATGAALVPLAIGLLGVALAVRRSNKSS